MSVTAAISYHSLKDASSEAKQVARKLTTYANTLNSSVYNKLNSYNGNYTGNIVTAKSKTNAKITELRNKSQAYTNYANDLSDLRAKCESTDKTVKSMVSNLTASFKSANGIKNSKVENTINYVLTGLFNSTAAGRWTSNTFDKVDSVKDYIKQSMKDWWDYEGGKELIKGSAIAVLEIVGGVCAVIAGIAAIIAGGTVLAIITAVAGVIVGVISTVNGMVNFINEERAYNQTHNNNDPALGRRLSGENTVQDYLRRETDSQFWHNFATGIDIVNGVCSVITFVNGVGNLMKNAYKWTTGSMANIKNLQVKNILTKNNFSNFIGKIKTTFTSGFGEIKNAIKLGNFTKIKNFAISFKDDFIDNLKEFRKGYTNFKNFSDGAKTVKNWSSTAKILISDDFSAKTIFVDGLIEEIVLPNIGLAKVVTYSPKDQITGGILAYKDSNISFTDITDAINIKKFFESGKNLYKNWFGSSNIVDTRILNKLSEPCNFSVAVPRIYIPTIHIKAA
jgi:hypothetical protein